MYQRVVSVAGGTAQPANVTVSILLTRIYAPPSYVYYVLLSDILSTSRDLYLEYIHRASMSANCAFLIF
jgi:hypothetical protein